MEYNLSDNLTLGKMGWVSDCSLHPIQWKFSGMEGAGQFPEMDLRIVGKTTELTSQLINRIIAVRFHISDFHCQLPKGVEEGLIEIVFKLL